MADTGRRDPRHRVSLPLTIHAGRTQLRAETEDVSFSGVFVVTHAALAVRQLVRIEAALPDGETFTAHAMVIFTRGPAADRRAGCGLQFFGLSREALARWAKLVRGAREREQSGAPAPAPPQRGTHAAVVLRVRPQGIDALIEVYTRDLAEGGMFLETDQPLLVGSQLTAEIVHPDTGEAFELSCVVRRVVQDPVRGLGVEFVGLDEVGRGKLHEFVSSVAPPIVIDEQAEA